MKKRILSLTLVLSMILSFSFTLPVGAADDIIVELDGTAITFDVPPQIINDRTMVPMRAIFEMLGADVDWNGDERKITGSKDNIEIVMYVDNTQMSVNGSIVTLDSPPTIIDGRTLVPVRAIAESFGVDVLWHGEIRTVSIYNDENTVEYEDMFNDYGEKISSEKSLQDRYMSFGWRTIEDFGELISTIKTEMTYALEAELNRTDCLVKGLELSINGNYEEALSAFEPIHKYTNEAISHYTNILSVSKNAEINTRVNQLIEYCKFYLTMNKDKMISKSYDWSEYINISSKPNPIYKEIEDFFQALLNIYNENISE